MLSQHINIESFLLGAAVSALSLLVLAFVVLQKRGTQRVVAALHDQLQDLKDALASSNEESRKARSQHEQDLAVLREAHTNQLDDLNRRHEAQVQSMRSEHAEAIEDARNELSIVSYPYEDTTGDDGWVVDDRTAEVGYKFQLFTRGVPCFEPHKVVTQRVQKKEVNHKKLEILKGEVAGLLTAIASRHPAFQVAQKFVSTR